MANYVSNVTIPASGGSATYDIRELFPHIGNCTVAAAAAAKTVTIGNFKLYTGAWVVVKFSNTNTADVASLTLNVDSTGAKPIKYRNANLSSAGLLIANRYTYFVYDGTNYQIVGDFDTGVPSNNVTGSGTSGYLTKWNGTNTVTNGPQLGSSTTTFLRNDGSWATPPGTYSHPTYTERSKDIYKFHVNTLGHVDDATALDKTDVSTLINKLDTGSSTPVDADYYISQYVGGGTTTTSYHRRPMSALWSYVKGKADSVYLPINHTYSLSIAADSGTNQLTLSASTKYKLTAGGSTFIFTTPPDTKNTAGSTDTSSKIFLVGATSQAANPQTYSDNEVYTTSGVLTTKKVQVGGGSCTMEYNSTTQSLDFVFT